MEEYELTNWPDLRERITVWEDSSALVVNKPPGLSVMGERHETDLVRMAEDAGERLWWVNRIDKVTSGAVVLAKSLDAHGALTRQFAKRTVGKAYLAICAPGAFPDRGTIDLPLLTAGSGRVRVAAERHDIKHDPDSGKWSVEDVDVLPQKKNYPSRTDYVNLWDDGQNALVLASPVTGRRHQIRVHLAWVGHAIVGDPLFVGKLDEPMPRTYLHSLRVAFATAGARPQWVEVSAEPDSDFWAPIRERLVNLSPDELLDTASAVSMQRE